MRPISCADCLQAGSARRDDFMESERQHIAEMIESDLLALHLQFDWGLCPFVAEQIGKWIGLQVRNGGQNLEALGPGILVSSPKIDHKNTLVGHVCPTNST